MTAMGTCRWLTCTSSLGHEYRMMWNGRVLKTFMCREHEDLLDEVFARRRRGEPAAPIKVSDEGVVYADLWNEIIFWRGLT